VMEMTLNNLITEQKIDHQYFLGMPGVPLKVTTPA
jgi:hypothetical protein